MGMVNIPSTVSMVMTGGGLSLFYPHDGLCFKDVEWSIVPWSADRRGVSDLQQHSATHVGYPLAIKHASSEIIVNGDLPGTLIRDRGYGIFRQTRFDDTRG